MRILRCMIGVLTLVLLVLAGCDRADEAGPSVAAVRGKDAREAIALANEWMGNGVTTYVTPTAVKFEFSGGRTATVDLPADEMVVAIAPYVDQTHPCEVHYMSGCQGELVDVPVDVVARLPNGTVLVDETMRTMSNGFIELWLPRGQDIALTLSAQGRSIDGVIGTHNHSNTCITTLQLL